MRRTYLAVLAAAMLAGTAALADTLDFTGLPAGNLGGSASVDGVTFEGNTSLRNRSDQHFGGDGGSICAQRGSDANCAGNMTVKFNGKVKKLTFSTAGHQPGDVAVMVVYRGKNVVGSPGFASNGKVDLRAFKEVTKLKITYEGVEDGYSFGKFTFVRVTTAKQRKAEAARVASATPVGETTRIDATGRTGDTVRQAGPGRADGAGTVYTSR